MTDIVEQLRDLQSGAQWVCSETAATLAQAADEIERLRAERAEAIDQRNAADLVLALSIQQSNRHSAERDDARRVARAFEVETEKAHANSKRWRAERDEAVAALALYRAENGCTRGQRTTQWCGEATKLRRAWLRVIQLENGCPASGGGCLSQQCGCVAEMQALSEYVEASHD